MEWHLCENSLPEKEGKYLCALKYDCSDPFFIVLPYLTDNGGAWNSHEKGYEIDNVYAWADFVATYNEGGLK